MVREELERWKVLANERGFELIAKEAEREQLQNDAAKSQVQLGAKEQIMAELQREAGEVWKPNPNPKKNPNPTWLARSGSVNMPSRAT